MGDTHQHMRDIVISMSYEAPPHRDAEHRDIAKSMGYTWPLHPRFRVTGDFFRGAAASAV